ncbi:MAG: hypothetical protein JXO22_09460 [Phycisphaerae bacterium]|nr:hypothetical protein [Phycisphaerae bacterium]
MDPKALKKAAKADKKAAKAQCKIIKKQPPPAPPRPGGSGAAASSDPADDRAVRAAEQKVILERWRTWIAAVGVLIALITLLVMTMGKG